MDCALKFVHNSEIYSFCSFRIPYQNPKWKKCIDNISNNKIVIFTIVVSNRMYLVSRFPDVVINFDSTLLHAIGYLFFKMEIPFDF